ncbi:MAG: energy transducer TonB [bacterium]
MRRRIERAKRYPTSARLQHLEGVVSLSFSIEPDGQVRALALVHSSGSDVLDQEALATVKRAAPLPYYANPIRISLRFYLEENE